MRRSRSRKNLVRETMWSRTYQVGKKAFAYESKFKAGGLSISVGELTPMWDSWGDSGKLDFASAFSKKVDIAGRDEKVLEFLMARGDERVLSTIALCLTRHSDRKMVLNFLLERLRSGSEPKGNFIQALAMLGDLEAVAGIREVYGQVSTEINRRGADADKWLILDFVVCCSALSRLEDSPSYREQIKPFLNHPNEAVRNISKLWFEG